MQITSHTVENSNLTLTLDQTFNQIDYTKMEVLSDNTVVCDKIKISYSKPKTFINNIISQKTSKSIMILITRIDKTLIQYAYFVDLQSNTTKIVTSETDQTKPTIFCPIKNQNIFANITKK